MIKEFIPFIDKERYLVIQLFEFFESQKNESYSLEEVAYFLNLSLYKTKIVVQDAIEAAQLLPETTLVLKNNDLLIRNFTSSSIAKIINYEASNSLFFKLFLHLNLNINQQSDLAFQKQVGISSATYFRLQKILKNKIGLEKTNRIKHSEIYARYYIYRVLFYFSYFDNISDEIKNFTDFNKMKQTVSYAVLIWHLKPTPTQQKQFNHFALVNLLRSKNHKRLFNSDLTYLVTLTPQNELALFTKHLINKWHILRTSAEIMTRYYITFLLMTYGLPDKHLNFIEKNSLIQDVTNQQISHVETLINRHFTDSELSNYKHKLLIANAKIFCPFFKIELLYPPQNYNYDHIAISAQLNVIINDLVLFITDILALDNNTTAINEIKKIYSLVILPKALKKYADLKIYVVVDFSAGNLLNEYITDTLNAMGNLNIHIDNVVNNNTDIYLTDTLNPSLSIHQIVWQNIPMEDEWFKLYNFIFNLRKQKLINSRIDDIH